jgi:hypothetical protein
MRSSMRRVSRRRSRSRRRDMMSGMRGYEEGE